jgi:2-polyprenyl-3-methyl-5-hydroxy-6-metoxy-1,4-benzoquinol methylase
MAAGSVAGRACPACGSERTRPAFTAGGHRWRRCRSCSTLFLEDPPTPGELASLYAGRRYFANPEYPAGKLLGYRDYLADRAELEQKFDRVLAQLERLAPPGRLLDIGAGPGLLVAAAAERGWAAEGVDLNEWAARTARDELGVAVRAGTLDGAGFPDESFDAVTMMDLIEHDPDPGALLAEAARVLRPGGALAIHTPDAGSFATRALGRRWPEVQRAPEHVVLFSVSGLSALLRERGLEPAGWHWLGKTSTLATLSADLAPAAPRLARPLHRWLASRPLGSRKLELDPRAKFCLYAVKPRTPPGSGSQRDAAPPVRLPKRPPAPVETAIHEELEYLASAERLCDWMFTQFAAEVHGSVAEAGAGIGTFSERLLEAGAEELLLLEPDVTLVRGLEHRFAHDPRVRIARESLPEAPSLEEASRDLVLCQNVLEHVDDDAAAVRTMARALRPGGTLALLVPAGPRLYGALDRSYGHRRRYDRGRVEALLVEAGLVLRELRPFNLLGVPGWWLKNRRAGARVGPRSLAAYELLVRGWRPLEQQLRPRWGLSLVALADHPAD